MFDAALDVPLPMVDGLHDDILDYEWGLGLFDHMADTTTDVPPSLGPDKLPAAEVLTTIGEGSNSLQLEMPSASVATLPRPKKDKGKKAVGGPRRN